MPKQSKKANTSKGSKKSFIKHDQFRDRNISPLESHKRQGNTLKNPFSVIPTPMTPRSWVNECIPNILWACLLAASLEREHYLRLFRAVAINIRENLSNHSELFITHNFISKLSEPEFDVAFRVVLGDKEAKAALSALLLIECLPDRLLWEARLEPPTAEHWQVLAQAVGVCFDHQSQAATDIRWIKLIFLTITGRVQFSKTQADFAESLRLYPNHGDMHSVRPMIRATELSLRTLEFGEEGNAKLPPPHQEAFWKEVHKKTSCLPPREMKPPETRRNTDTRELIRVANVVAEHFHATIEQTGIDARHDSSFGLVLYAINLLIESAATYSHSSAIGRSTLRSIVECFITLSYLITKNDAGLWLKHRDYGNGQAKLSFLKNLAIDAIPRFIDLKRLEFLANEDKWIEFSDINLGAWSAQNLRTMAIEANLKEVYDCYYDVCSGYTHGHWSAIKDAAFVTCLNPLHRFHRIPSPINFGLRSVVDDGAILINRMLDDLTKIYPGMKHRVSLEKTNSTTKPKSGRKTKKRNPSRPTT